MFGISPTQVDETVDHTSAGNYTREYGACLGPNRLNFRQIKSYSVKEL